ncbi:MAG TPA: hypothetical protein VH598_09170 [Verrucomicrobiae bacterium]|nr:hypothetical protein [Verrucomicrobiae bacterium]
MSFLSDFFEGNWGNLGTDVSHTFSSLAAHPDELAETLGVGALVAAPFVLPEIGAAIGAGGAVEGAAAADLGGAALGADAAGIGASDLVAGGLEAGAADATAGGAELGLGGLGELGDLAAAGDAALPAAGELTAFAPETGAFDVLAPGGDVFGGAGGGDVFASGAADTGPAVDAGAGAADAGVVDNLGTAVTAAGPTGVDTTPASLDAANKAFGTFNPGSFATNTADAGTGSFFGSLTDSLGSTLSNPWFKLAAGAAPLALALGMGEAKLPAAANAANAQALQMQQAGLTDLSNARAGVLNAGQTAVLGQMRTDLTNQWRQTLFNQGVQDPSKDTRWPQVEALIDSQVTQQTATMIQQNVTNALAETGQAQQALLAIAQMQMNADTAFTNNLINATKSLGLVAGLSSAKVTIG